MRQLIKFFKTACTISNALVRLIEKNRNWWINRENGEPRSILICVDAEIEKQTKTREMERKRRIRRWEME